MKWTSKSIFASLLVLTLSSCSAQMKNCKTEQVKIYGNCEMCEKTIENAGYIRSEAKVDWDKDNKLATITYDSTKTNQDEILKRIALSGYDSDKFLAPDDVYAKLPGCCQYERTAKTVTLTETAPIDPTINETSKTDSITAQNNGATSILNEANPSKEEKLSTHKMDHNKMDSHTQVIPQETIPANPPLKAVFDNYFALKDALVNTDQANASTKAGAMLLSISDVKMEKLSADEHRVWMNIFKEITSETKQIADAKDIANQRSHFSTLSKNMYDLIKVSKQESPTYIQHCPMYNDGEGADWLSKENAVKNPYYGALMMSCGKTIETIK